ncbi:MAG: helix-hairpin-helix domain-containing protein [Oscillospiraceae bacterium]|nr:helix-hairpin-helix domain-containing protein [Oscillospiraceae bacterium]
MKQNRTEWAAIVLSVVFLAAAVAVTAVGNRSTSVAFAPLTVTAAEPTPSDDISAQTAAAEPERININTATAAELESLPGIGPKLAARIVDYRAANGPFQSPEELMNVSGIGEKTYAGLAEQIIAGTANQEGTE